MTETISTSIQRTDSASGLTPKQTRALELLTARACDGVFFSRDIRALSISDGTMNALIRAKRVEHVQPTAETGFRCFYRICNPEKDRYFSGTTAHVGEGRPAADVFVDSGVLTVGLHDGRTGLRITLSTEDALKLASILMDGAAHAENWWLP